MTSDKPTARTLQQHQQSWRI